MAIVPAATFLSCPSAYRDQTCSRQTGKHQDIASRAFLASWIISFFPLTTVSSLSVAGLLVHFNLMFTPQNMKHPERIRRATV